MRLVACVLALAGCGRLGFDAADGSAPFLDGYQRRKQIRIGPLITTDIDDVPFSIALENDAEIAAGARADGSDFVVTAADGVTRLGYEVVSWQPATGLLDLWIRVPSLSGSEPTVAYLYYDGPASVPTSAWPATYRGVWHMDDTGGAWLDSARGNNAIQTTTSLRPLAIAGVVGGAATYDGLDDTIDAGDPFDGSLDFGATESFAYWLWVRVDEFAGSFDVVFHKGGSNAVTPGYDMELGDNAWKAHIADGTSIAEAVFGDVGSFLGRGWFQLLAVVDREMAQLKVFVNTAQVNAISISTIGDLTTDRPVKLGRDTDFFRGVLDEVRIYVGLQLRERLAIEYANFTQPDAYVVGPEETR